MLDSFFWPVMPYSVVASKLDKSHQPDVIQPYNVPPPQKDEFHRHDLAAYSIWMHFVDSCLAITESANCVDADKAPCFSAPDLPFNSHTELPRLPIFRALSAGPLVAQQPQQPHNVVMNNYSQSQHHHVPAVVEVDHSEVEAERELSHHYDSATLHPLMLVKPKKEVDMMGKERLCVSPDTPSSLWHQNREKAFAAAAVPVPVRHGWRGA